MLVTKTQTLLPRSLQSSGGDRQGQRLRVNQGGKCQNGPENLTQPRGLWEASPSCTLKNEWWFARQQREGKSLVLFNSHNLISYYNLHVFVNEETVAQRIQLLTQNQPLVKSKIRIQIQTPALKAVALWARPIVSYF